jgi:DNA polymerase III delta subunit
MPTRDRLVSIVVDRELHRRIQAEATQQRKSVSRFVRDLLAERLQPPRRRPRSRNALLRLCGLAHGELSVTNVDVEVYDR